MGKQDTYFAWLHQDKTKMFWLFFQSLFDWVEGLAKEIAGEQKLNQEQDKVIKDQENLIKEQAEVNQKLKEELQEQKRMIDVSLNDPH